MPDTPVPWVGLAALVAMFLLPYLLDRLFERPRTSKPGHTATFAATAALPGPTGTPATPPSVMPARRCGASFAGLGRRPN
jgi:hypothetical protein